MSAVVRAVPKILPAGRKTTSSRSAPGTASCIGTTIIAVTHAIERQVNSHLTAYDLPPGMTLNRIWALVQLFHQQQQGQRTRMSDFADALGITARSVTSVVDLLEDQGLLERSDDHPDRRVTLLQLTARAQQMMPEFERVLQDVGEHICAPLPEPEQKELLRLLGKLCR
jgi:DNA-binding MarR family transcriptional regulator